MEVQMLATVDKEQPERRAIKRAGTCRKHGGFTETGSRWQDQKRKWHDHWYGCQKCVQERNQAHEEFERRMRAQQCLGDANIPARFQAKTLSSFHVETD